MQVENMVHDAAMEAENFVTQANVNLNEAKEYYRRAAKNEEVLRDQLRQEKVMVKKREREAWLTQERYNNSCELDSCVKGKYNLEKPLFTLLTSLLHAPQFL